jgi:hypothetical protein
LAADRGHYWLLGIETRKEYREHHVQYQFGKAKARSDNCVQSSRIQPNRVADRILVG